VNLRRAFHASVAVAGLALAASAATAETLTDALIGAYNHSNLLEQNRALLRAADEDVAIALSSLRPLVNFAASGGYTTTRSGSDLGASLSLSADLLLFDFGRSKMSLDLTKEVVLATRDALVVVEQNVLFSAVQAYMNMLRTQEFVALRQSNVRLITEELRAARDRFELGEVTMTDVAIAEARLALSRANLAAAEGDLAEARELFRTVVGRYPGQLAPPPVAPQTAKNVEEARAIGLRTHPSLRQAQREVTIAELNIAIAEAAMKPQLTGGAGATLRDSGARSADLSVRLSGPIYQGGRLSAQYRKAVARRDSSRAALLQSSAIITQNVAIAWADVAVTTAQLDASERQIRAARVAYNGVREEATLGARTTLDVLNAEQELLDAQANRISAYSQLYIATYALLREMGLLTVDHLSLGIPTYDPEAYYNTVRSAPVRKVSPQGEKLDRVLRGLGKN
jgi:outer membrane protein